MKDLDKQKQENENLKDINTKKDQFEAQPYSFLLHLNVFFHNAVD